MQWHALTNITRPEAGEIHADVHVPQDSDWFCGHFPGQPVLPGIAQLAMVFDAIHQASGQSLKITGVSRIRFKLLIKPDDRLRVFADARGKKAGVFSFRIMVADELVCSGIITVENRDKPGEPS